MIMGPLLLSFAVATVATICAGVLGTLLATLLARTKFPGRDWLDVLVTAPMVLPPTVLGYYLLVVLGRDSGLGQMYEAVFASPLVFTRTAAVVAATIGALPLVVKAVRAALDDIDPDLIAAARCLGAGPVRRFFTILLPLARSGLVAGLSLGFARALGDFGVTLMIAGNIPGRTQTAALAIYDAVQAGRDSDAAGMAAVLAAVAIVILYTATRVGQR